MHLLLALAASLSFQSPPALTTPTAERPNIVFIYADDHAERAVGACGSPLTKTPLIIRDPRTDQAGTIVDHLVQNIDMAPTILDLAGVEAPTAMHGTSLAPFLTSHHPADWRTSIYYHYQQRDSGRVSHTVAPHYGIRTATHKLIHIYPETAFELYDLRVDPLRAPQPLRRAGLKGPGRDAQVPTIRPPRPLRRLHWRAHLSPPRSPGGWAAQRRPTSPTAPAVSASRSVLSGSPDTTGRRGRPA